MTSPSKKKTVNNKKKLSVNKKKNSVNKKKISEKTSLSKDITFNIGPKNEMDNIRLHFLENILHLVKSKISGDDLIEIKIRLSQFNEHLEKICKKLPEGISIFKDKTCIVNLTNLLRRLVIKIEKAEPIDHQARKQKNEFFRTIPTSLTIIKRIS